MRSIRKACKESQESIALRFKWYGLPITRQMVANYECGRCDVPARYIPIIAHMLNVDIADLLPPLSVDALQKLKWRQSPVLGHGHLKHTYHRQKRTACNAPPAIAKVQEQIS